MVQLAVTEKIDAGGLINIAIADIAFFESAPPHHVAVHTADKVYYAHGNVKVFATLLERTPGCHFYMADKGVLANADRVLNMDTSNLYFAGSKSCPVSRQARKKKSPIYQFLFDVDIV